MKIKNKETDIRKLPNNDFANLLIHIIKSDEKEAKAYMKYFDKILKTPSKDEFTLKSLSEV